MSATPAARTRCYHYDEDGAPWREGGCPRDPCPYVHPLADADADDNALWASAKAPKTALPGYMYHKLHPEKREERTAARREKFAQTRVVWRDQRRAEKSEKRAQDREEEVDNTEEDEDRFMTTGIDAGPESALVKSNSDDWETDDESAEVEAQGSTSTPGTSQQNTSECAPPPEPVTAHGPAYALGGQPRVQRVAEPKRVGVTLTEKHARKLRYHWTERIRLLSLCATTSSSIAALAADTARGGALLASSAFRALGAADRARLARQHAALRARLRDEKMLEAGARVRLVGGAAMLPLSLEMSLEMSLPLRTSGKDGADGVDEAARERVMQGTVEKGEGVEAEAEAEADEQPEEGEVDHSPDEIAPQDTPAGDEGEGEDELKEQKREQHEQARARMVRLTDKVARMKRVLGEMHEMARRRAVQQRVHAAQAGLGKRKRERGLDVGIDAEADEGPARVSVSVAPSRLAPASAHDVQAVRVELEQSVHHVADIHAQIDDKAGVTAGLVQLAFDAARVQRAAAAQERQEAEQAEFHAEVSEELAQLTNKTAGLDAQVRDVDATLAGVLLRVDSLEQMVEEERRRRDEARTRVDEMKLRLKSYAALQAQNTAAISSLRTTLDACVKQADVASPMGLSTHPPAPTSLATPMYPTSLAIAQSLAPSMADTAYPLLNHARGEIAGMLQHNSSRMLRTFDARMQQTLDIVEEFTTRSMSSHTAIHRQTMEGPLLNEGSGYNNIPVYPATSRNMLHAPSQGFSTYTTPNSHFSSIMPVPGPHPPSHFVDYTPPPNSYPRRDPSTSLSNITNTNTAISTTNMPYPDFDPSPNMEIPLPKADMPHSFNQSSVSDQLDCWFLADPDLRGVPVRLKHKDTRSGVSWPFTFVKIIPPTSSHGTSGHGDRVRTIVEVQDCRNDSLHSGGIYRFHMDVLCYVPPTAKYQIVVCVAPGVDRTQQYYILGFNAHNESIVRRHPVVPNSQLIYFATHMLAQVAPPSITPAPATASRPVVPSNAAAIPKVHVDCLPPMWLKDLAFSGVPIQLQERDGDGSILEFVGIDAFTSTVVVRSLVDPAPERSIPLSKVRHVIPSAAHQMVVGLAGYSKGLIMKVETYGTEECILYSPLKRRGQATHLEQRYKTAELAVISPSRRC